MPADHAIGWGLLWAAYDTISAILDMLFACILSDFGSAMPIHWAYWVLLNYRSGRTRFDDYTIRKQYLIPMNRAMEVHFISKSVHFILTLACKFSHRTVTRRGAHRPAINDSTLRGKSNFVNMRAFHYHRTPSGILSMTRIAKTNCVYPCCAIQRFATLLRSCDEQGCRGRVRTVHRAYLRLSTTPAPVPHAAGGAHFVFCNYSFRRTGTGHYLIFSVSRVEWRRAPCTRYEHYSSVHRRTQMGHARPIELLITMCTAYTPFRSFDLRIIAAVLWGLGEQSGTVFISQAVGIELSIIHLGGVEH